MAASGYNYTITDENIRNTSYSVEQITQQVYDTARGQDPNAPVFQTIENDVATYYKWVAPDLTQYKTSTNADVFSLTDQGNGAVSFLNVDNDGNVSTPNYYYTNLPSTNNGIQLTGETIDQISEDFIDNSSIVGGAIRSFYNVGGINSITGDFIGHSVGGSIIYNKSLIDSITGDFIGGNSAIRNVGGTINSVTGNFIGTNISNEGRGHLTLTNNVLYISRGPITNDVHCQITINIDKDSRVTLSAIRNNGTITVNGTTMGTTGHLYLPYVYASSIENSVNGIGHSYINADVAVGGTISQNTTINSGKTLTISANNINSGILTNHGTLAFFGETLGSLTKLAKDMNLRSRQNKSGKTISREHIRDILNNPFYYGMMKNGNDWVPHQYEPLIDKTLFDIVQDVLKGKKKQNFTMGGPDKDFIFRGLLRCGHCGGCITSEYHISKSGKRHNYLKCNNHGASKSNCPQCIVREEDILQQLSNQIFSQIHVNEDFINAVKSGVKEHILQENRVNRASKQSIALQIQSIRNRESKLLDMFLDGKCTQVLYDEKSAGFKEEIKKLEAGLEQNADITKDVTTALNHIIEVAGQAATIMNCSINSKKREFLKTILSNGVLTDTSACFYLKKPFDKLLFAKGCKMWLGQLDSNQ